MTLHSQMPIHNPHTDLNPILERIRNQYGQFDHCGRTGKLQLHLAQFSPSVFVERRQRHGRLGLVAGRECKGFGTHGCRSGRFVPRHVKTARCG